MFCTQCGADINDDAAFCANCGAPVNGSVLVQDVASLQGTLADDALAIQPAATSSHGQKGKKPLVIGIVVAVVVVCLIVAGIVWFTLDQDAKAKREPHSVVLSITAEGYTNADTLIPVQASGTDLDGNSISELFFVDSDGRGVSLPKGDYVLSVPASPLTADGVLYKDDDSEYSISVPTDSEPGIEIDVSSQINVVLEKSTALDETKDMIDRAREYALKDEGQTEKAEQLAQKVEQVHDEAVAAKQHAEEVAQARQNPASVNAMSGSVTLKGKLIRKELTTDDTNMGWAAVNYVLQFDSPVKITYRGPSGQAETNSFNSIQVASEEVYLATNPNANSSLGSISIAALQPYVGQYIAVTGDIYNTGNAHTLGNARFGDYSVSKLPS